MDYLKHYPVSSTPETWAFDAIFRRVDAEQHYYWQQKGFYWKFGQEHEFIPRTLANFEEKIINAGYATCDELRVISPYLVPSLDLYERFKGRQDDQAIALALDKLIDYVRRSKSMAQFSLQTDAGKVEILDHLRSYKTALLDTDRHISDLARQNAYLAYLHLLPAGRGGVSDLISKRFGSYAYGVGWWDNPGVTELRTQPIRDPADFIRTNHRIIRNIYQAAEIFKIIPCSDNVGSHVHFSLWRAADDTNVMRMQTAEDLALADRMMTGLYILFMQAPNLVNDFDPQSLAGLMQISTNTTRGHFIRQTGDTWELRRPYKSGFVHSARDLALIMSGTAFGAFEIADIEAHRKATKINIRHVSKPVLKNRFDGEISSLQRVLEASTIGDNGHIVPDTDAIKRYFFDLLRILGPDNVDAFSFVPNGQRKAIDLGERQAWAAMLASIKIDGSNNALDTAHLDTRLQDMLSNLSVQGRRHILVGDTVRIATGITRLGFAAEKLKASSALVFMVGPDSVTKIAGHYNQLYKHKAVQAGSILAESMTGALREFISKHDDAKNDDEPDKVKDAIARQVHNSFIKDCLIEEVCAAMPTEGRKERRPIYIYSDYQSSATSLKTITPEFRKALERKIDLLRQEPLPDNALISSMHDALDFIDRDIIDWRSYGEFQIANTNLSAYVDLLNGASDKKARKGVKFFASMLTVYFQMALQDNRYSLDDVDRMIVQSRVRCQEMITEQMEALVKGVRESDADPQHKAIVFKALTKINKWAGRDFDTGLRNASRIVADVRRRTLKVS